MPNSLLDCSIFQSLQQEIFQLKNKGIEYLGYRAFYDDGSTLGLCNYDKWGEISNKEHFKIAMANHHKNELTRVIQSDYKFLTRLGNDTQNSSYLETLYQNKLWNTLVIYNFKADKIEGYYFISSSENSHIMDSFMNNLAFYENLCKVMQIKIDKALSNKEPSNLLRFGLFTQQEANLIFKAFHKKDAANLPNNFKIPYEYQGNKYLLTKREIENIKMISLDLSHKEIADKFNISTRTVEKQVQALKHKLNLNTKKDIEEFAKVVFSNNSFKW
jgi:DNA-binding CsgD family transcriptional regulator